MKIPLRRSARLALAVTLAFASTAAAQVIPAGIDLFSTPADGETTVELTIPADFFCEGSAADVVDLALKGRSLGTSPPGELGSTDTVIYRTEEIDLSKGIAEDVPIRIVGLSLEGIQTYSACGVSWQVRACLDDAEEQPEGSMTVTLNGAGNGGTFDAELPVDAIVYFRNGATILGPLSAEVALSTTGASWADEAGSGAVTHEGSIQLSNCNDSPAGPSYPGTGGFFPGWAPDDPDNPPPCSNPPCSVPIVHDSGDHAHFTIVPVPGPGPGCPRSADLAVAFNPLSPYYTSGNLSFQFHALQPCAIEVLDSRVLSTNGAACSLRDLQVKEGGSGRGFSIASADPCVLDLD